MKHNFVQFSPTVTAGNLLQIITIGCAMVAAYVNIQVRLARNEEKLQALSSSVEKVGIAASQTAQALDRVSARMDQHLRSRME